MIAHIPFARKTAARLFAIMSLIWLAACDVSGIIPSGASNGPRIDPNAPVQVALLVPGGSGESSDSFLAQNLENAARLAISDLQGVQIDLRVYNTGGNAAQASNAAITAVNDGAKIIIGPLFAHAANAASVAVASRNVNVLAFSNNTSIAGGNLFVLGATFQNTANRLVGYAGSQGVSRYLIVHGDDVAGAFGREAIASAIRNHGSQVAGVQAYALSQQGIASSVPQIAAAVRSTGAEAVFLTAGVNSDLPLIATSLPQAGVNPANTRYIGLTRWDAAPQALVLPGLQGGLFAMPDTTMNARFVGRYTAAYGEAPHALAGLAYDGIAAIGALLAQGNANALTTSALTQASGFQGTNGIFRLMPNGTNERGLAVATVRNNQVVILDAAPTRFGGAGF